MVEVTIPGTRLVDVLLVVAASITAGATATLAWGAFRQLRQLVLDGRSAEASRQEEIAQIRRQVAAVEAAGQARLKPLVHGQGPRRVPDTGIVGGVAVAYFKLAGLKYTFALVNVGPGPAIGPQASLLAFKVGEATDPPYQIQAGVPEGPPAFEVTASAVAIPANDSFDHPSWEPTIDSDDFGAAQYLFAWKVAFADVFGSRFDVSGTVFAIVGAEGEPIRRPGT